MGFDFLQINVLDEPGTQFLICTDGVTKELGDLEIEAELRKQLPPQETVEGIIDAGLANGGRDNITAVVVRIES